MTRTALNFWIDLVMFLALLALITTGGIVYFVLPSGTGHSHSLFGLGRHDFGEIHFILSLVFVAMSGLHLFLHWNWICCVIGKSFGCASPSHQVRVAWGFFSLLGILSFLGLGLWWAKESVQSTRLPHKRHDHQSSSIQPFEAEQKDPSEGRPTESVSLNKTQPGLDLPLKSTLNSAQDKLGTGKRHLEDCPAGEAIHGRMSLLEAARLCSLDLWQMKKNLNLPASVQANDRLGHLKRQHGLSLPDVRRLACREKKTEHGQ